MPIATAPALINANSFSRRFGTEQLGIGQTVDDGGATPLVGVRNDRFSAVREAVSKSSGWRVRDPVLEVRGCGAVPREGVGPTGTGR
jgi:hypothetical protein